MFSLSQAFHRLARRRDQRPVVLAALINAHGARVYGERMPSAEQAGLVAVPLANGALLADGSTLAGQGALNLLERGARLMSLGRLRESLSTQDGRLLASLAQGEPSGLSLVLDNAGPQGAHPFSRVEAVEGLLGARVMILVGFPGLPAREFMVRFSGQVESYRLEAARITLTAKA